MQRPHDIPSGKSDYLATDDEFFIFILIRTPASELRSFPMSQCFRPVKEIWNTHTACFVRSENLILLLHDLAARAGTASDEHGYGDNTAVWIENGAKALDYIESALQC
jgi:hypothetical protein